MEKERSWTEKPVEEKILRGLEILKEKRFDNWQGANPDSLISLIISNKGADEIAKELTSFSNAVHGQSTDPNWMWPAVKAIEMTAKWRMGEVSPEETLNSIREGFTGSQWDPKELEKDTEFFNKEMWEQK
jgi:hypothetical protein